MDNDGPANTTISVEVVYALPDQQYLIKVHLAAGATLGQAVRASGLLNRFPELVGGLSSGDISCGIFGEHKPKDTLLQAGDRVEIYRPLIIDPKTARRLRADKAG